MNGRIEQQIDLRRRRGPASPHTRCGRGLARRRRVLRTHDPLGRETLRNQRRLIYQYFTDKQDIFTSLLNESQIESRSFVAALPRDQGVAALLAAVIPESTRQWGRVGRFTATWRDIEGDERAERESVREVRRTAREYNSELHAALTEAAASEGRALRDDPSMLPFVLSVLQGVADTIVHNWATDLDHTELTEFAAASLTRAITASEESRTQG